MYLLLMKSKNIEYVHNEKRGRGPIYMRKTNNRKRQSSATISHRNIAGTCFRIQPSQGEIGDAAGAEGAGSAAGGAGGAIVAAGTIPPSSGAGIIPHDASAGAILSDIGTTRGALKELQLGGGCVAAGGA